MDRMFKNSRPSEITKDRPAINERETVDLSFIEKRKAQRDEAMEAASSKRKRPNPKMVDKLQDQAGSSRISDMGVSPRRTELPDPMEEVLPKINVRTTRSKRHLITTEPSEKERSPSLDIFPEEKRYSRIHGLGPRWKKPLVYPKEGKKKATVDWEDLERLDEGQFLNDNLVGFYLRYLEHRLELERPDVAKKVYWFNTYFFASLTQTARGKKGINYDAVRKWTRNVDILTYDYAVVPINESAHWYVVIICNLPALNRIAATPTPDSTGSTIERTTTRLDGVDKVHMQGTITTHNDARAKDPGESDEQDTRESFEQLNIQEEDDGMILRVETPERIIDNMDGASAHQGTFQEESKVQQVEMLDNSVAMVPLQNNRKAKRKSNLPVRTMDPDQPAIITLDSLGLKHPLTTRALKVYLHLEVEDKRGGMKWEDSQLKGMSAQQIPLQDNFCDCGLFLLEYMKKFDENPEDFVKKVMLKQYDERKDWPKLVSSEMRANLRDLIRNLHEEQQSGAKGEKGKVRSGTAKVNVVEGTKNPKSQINAGNRPTELNIQDAPGKHAPEAQGESLAIPSKIYDPKTKEVAMSIDDRTHEVQIRAPPGDRGDSATKERDSPPTTEIGWPSSRDLALANALSIDDLSQYALKPTQYCHKLGNADTGTGKGMPSTSRGPLVVIPDSQPSQLSQPEKCNKFLEPETIGDRNSARSPEIHKTIAFTSQAQTPHLPKQRPEAVSLPSITPNSKRERKDILDTKAPTIIDISDY